MKIKKPKAQKPRRPYALNQKGGAIESKKAKAERRSRSKTKAVLKAWEFW